jgi:acyl carrier protein
MHDKLNALVARILHLPEDTVTDETSMANSAPWTSLHHFNLILAVESAFAVRFSSARIPELASVAALRQELQTLLGTRE